MDKNEPRSELT
jgi:hypothetical protein